MNYPYRSTNDNFAGYVNIFKGYVCKRAVLKTCEQSDITFILSVDGKICVGETITVIAACKLTLLRTNWIPIFEPRQIYNCNLYEVSNYVIKLLFLYFIIFSAENSNLIRAFSDNGESFTPLDSSGTF